MVAAIGKSMTPVQYAAAVLLALAGVCSCSTEAQAQSNVLVSFSTTNSIPLNPGFAGFCTEMLADSVEYYDTNFQRLVATLSPGWLRYPGGSTEDAFDWTNGMTPTNWITAFLNWPAETNLLWPTVKLLGGKGGALFSDFAAMCANVGGAKIVVTINGFTDTNTSAGAFAAYAHSNHIVVSAWELCNEPYVFGGSHSSFWTNSTNYVIQMKSYRDAIKAADSNAVVAIYFDDAGQPIPNSWDRDLSNYTDKYWDAVAYHHYPQLPTNGVSFADLMALDNWELASNTSTRVQNYLMPMNNSNVTYLISEFNPSIGNGSGGQYPPTSTLYGGIYAAEYLLRMSTVPQMHFVGPYQLLDANGIAVTNNNFNPVTTAYYGGYYTNTAGMPFGFYLSAQVCGSSIANWALTRSVAVYQTTVGTTNCPTVPIDTNGIATIPTIYAQAYQGGNGKRYVVLTNKGSNSVPVQISQDGNPLANQFLETYITGTDPSVTNAPPPKSSVVIQTNTVSNPVTIPEYSVVRLEWTVFDVPQPALALSASSAMQDLHWAGLTNVTYWVQSTTNLPPAWSTLGSIANTSTNFSFTNWNSGPKQFYRLQVQ
jgi:alpha-L-arabinofuranosidase